MRPQQGLLRSLALYPFWRLEDWDLTTKTIFTHGSFAMSIKQKLKPIKVQEIEIKFAQNWNWTEHSSTGEHRKYKMRGFLVPKRHILAKRAQFPIIFRSNQISSCPQHSCFWLPSAYPLEVLVWVCVCVCVCVCVTGLQRFDILRSPPSKALFTRVLKNTTTVFLPTTSASQPSCFRNWAVLKPPTVWLTSLRHKSYWSVKRISPSETWSASCR